MLNQLKTPDDLNTLLVAYPAEELESLELDPQVKRIARPACIFLRIASLTRAKNEAPETLHVLDLASGGPMELLQDGLGRKAVWVDHGTDRRYYLFQMVREGFAIRCESIHA